MFQQARYTQTTNSTAPHTTGSGVKVSTRNGSISIRKASDTTEVAIQATLRMVTSERLGEASIIANRNSAGVLEISAQPPSDGWRGGEGCSFDITVPDAGGVELRSTNGAIKLAGLSGPAKLDTSNGSITIAGHSGDVEADTSNGAVDATGISGNAHIKTSNGGVKVSLADTSSAVQIKTSNGAVTLELSRAFRGELSVDTSNGSIRLPQSGPSNVNTQMRQSKNRATMIVGDATSKSSIDTSNGSVTVRYAD
jgi:DUF4097 and DUF4098 domain-containing protein YvlB